MKMKDLGIILGLAFLMGVIATPAFSAESKADPAKKEVENSTPQAPLIPVIYSEDDLVKDVSKEGEKLSRAAEKKSAPKFVPPKGKSEKKEEKAPAAASAAPQSPTLEKHSPQILVSKWGSEIRINVAPDKAMKKDQMLSIQSIKLESDKGEFLGLKTYGPEEKTRDAEFMVNPEILKIENVKIVVSMGSEGEWSKIVSLKVEEPKVEEAAETPEAAPAAETAAKDAAALKPSQTEKPKKKGWLW